MVLKQQQRVKTDILVIGGGAGLRATITAIPKGVRVLL
jgi:succinate dehydrogenase/fumarate reductase flavoprotein subunit